MQLANSNSLVGCDVTPANLIDVNPATASVTIIGKLGDPVVGALAWNPVTKVLYGTSTKNHTLLTINPATGATKTVGSFTAALSKVTLRALRTFHSKRNRSRMFAFGILRACEEFAVSARLDHHCRTTFLAFLVGGFVFLFRAIESLGVFAFRIFRTGDERSEPA